LEELADRELKLELRLNALEEELRALAARIMAGELDKEERVEAT
jgi:hypothetical protein